MPESPAPRSTGDDHPGRRLADELRRRSDADLAHLVTTRPDLGRPAPTDLTTLAVRALSPASVRRALDGLDADHLQALEAVAVAEGTTTIGAVAASLGVDVDTAARLLDDLSRAALVRLDGDAVEVLAPVAEALAPVAGLAPVHPDDADVPVTDLLEVLADAPPGAKDVLAGLTWGPPAGTLDPHGPAGAPVRWLLDRRILRADGAQGRVVLPRPVALALRGGRLHRDAPALPDPTRLDPTRVDETAGAAAGDLLGLVDEIIDAWGADPPRVLRAGGLAVRDLSRLCTRLDLDVHRTALLLEVMNAARLLTDDGGAEPAWAPTHLVDTWADGPDAARWAALAIAWLDMPRAPHRIGTRRDGVGVNALSESAGWGALPMLRREILAVARDLEPGCAPGPEATAGRLRRRHPRWPTALVDEVVAPVLAEAELLGITGAGALSAAGRVLLDDDPDPEPVADAARLPDPVGQLVLQADLTAIVPGRLAPHLAAFMRRAAETESRGGARTYRFTPSTVARLFDDGWDAESALRTLAAASVTPVPQPLEYLVTDVARRHGRVRLGVAGSYLRTEDATALDTLLVTPDVAGAGLRRIAPTVLISPLPPTRLLTLLRTAGVSVLAEGADGAVVSGAAAPARATTPRPPRPRVSPPPDGPAVVAALRRADQASGGSDVERGGATVDPVVVVSVLRSAIDDGGSVVIEVVGSDGSATRRRVRPERVHGGLLHGVDIAAGRPATWSVHRIRAAHPDTTTEVAVDPTEAAGSGTTPIPGTRGSDRS